MKLKPLSSLLLYGVLLTSSHLAIASPGALEQSPLYVGPAVESNIMILSDDSGSMDWEIMSRDLANGGRFTATQPDGTDPGNGGSVKHRDANDDGTADCTFADSYSSDGYIYGVEFGSNTYTDNSSDCHTADDEAWRFRNSDFNPLYFDPNKTYLPWAGVNSSGVAYTDADITNAPNDPYNPTERIDLTRHNSDWAGSPSVRRTSDRDEDTVADGFRYYTWSDAVADGGDDDGNFDNGEETEYLIKDQDAATQQNFANWFTYHRSREFVAKYAISRSLQETTGVRIGYGTINGNSGVGVEIASMNVDPSVGNKRTLFNHLFSTNSASGTPLRGNLRNVGRYFECVTGNFFGVSGTDCPILPASDFGMCQKNFTIMMTDGFYNGSSPSVGNTDTDGTGDYDGGDYADSHSNTLADVAMHYYERDLATGLNDEVPAAGLDNAPHQHMTTYTVAFGVTGTLDPDGTKTPGDASDTDPSDAGFSWPNPNTDEKKIDDLWHTAFNGRGDFFSAQDPTALINAIQAAVVSASKGSSSASAVAFNSSKIESNSTSYQAIFNPADNWKGELVATAINIDGTLATTPSWNAGDLLNNKSPASRQIITYKVDTVTPANSTGIPFRILANLSTSQQADLNRGPAAADGNGQARLDYLRGDRSNESTGLLFRDRTNVLGDLVNSNPVYVGKTHANYPDIAPFPATTGNLYSEFKTAQASRAGVVYVGANDGMLHAFRESDGEEIFAYVPNAVFSSNNNEGLHYLTDTGYSHRYYVDLSPTIADAYINSAWRTILIGGTGAGGRGIFALDVTNPTTLTSAETNAASIIQWEFTSDDDADFGYVTGKPTIAKMENGRWAVIVSNGYNSTGTGNAMLFIIYLDGGQDGEWTLGTDYFKIDTKVGGVGAALNGLSTPIVIDTDKNLLVDRAYAGDLKGNLWAFDLSDDATSNPAWEVAYRQGANNPKPLFTATDGGGIAQPITSRPNVKRQSEIAGSPSNAPNLMVYFGTGQYIVAGDKTSTTTQTFYGVWDKGTKELDRSTFLEQTVDTTNSTTENRVLTNNAINYGSSHNGWYFDLPISGERVTINPVLRGKVLIYATLIPGSELCQPQGDGSIMAVSPVNGGRLDFIAFDVNNDGVIDANDQVNGYNPSSYRVGGIPGGLGTIGDMLMVTNDDAQITSTRFNYGTTNNEGRLSWQEITR